MQPPATLFDFVSARDIAIFLGLPVLLLIAVFLEKYFDWKASRGAATKGAPLRKILEWQAKYPTVAWVFWILVWTIVFYLLFRPNPAGGV